MTPVNARLHFNRDFIPDVNALDLDGSVAILTGNPNIKHEHFHEFQGFQTILDQQGTTRCTCKNPSIVKDPFEQRKGKILNFSYRAVFPYELHGPGRRLAPKVLVRRNPSKFRGEKRRWHPGGCGWQGSGRPLLQKTLVRIPGSGVFMHSFSGLVEDGF